MLRTKEMRKLGELSKFCADVNLFLKNFLTNCTVKK